MIDDMRRRLPPYVYREHTRHGRAVLYFRRGKERRVRLPDDIYSEAFESAYEAALKGRRRPHPRGLDAPVHTLHWLVHRYRESGAWRALAPATRKQRDLFFRDAIERSGNAPFAAIRRADIQRAVDRRADTPGQANNFLKAMRGLFAWATRNAHVEHDPCAGVERMRYRTDGFPVWTTEEVDAFRERHRIGTKARLALELLLLTGLRRSDIVRVGRQHLRGDVLTIRTTKTDTPVSVRLPPALLEVLAVSPVGDLRFIVTEHGRPYTPESFGNWFRERAGEAGVAKNAHGLRKLSATLAANGGAGTHQLMAQFGWKTIAQAELYTREADRARLGVQSSDIVAAEIDGNIPRTLNPGAGKSRKKPMKSTR